MSNTEKTTMKLNGDEKAPAQPLTAGQRAILNEMLAAVSVNLNPYGVACPLCRRTKTVTLLSVNQASGHREKPVSEYACSYDGCRGYQFSI